MLSCGGKREEGRTVSDMEHGCEMTCTQRHQYQANTRDLVDVAELAELLIHLAELLRVRVATHNTRDSENPTLNTTASLHRMPMPGLTFRGEEGCAQRREADQAQERAKQAPTHPKRT